jgi:hypothetical protein
MVSSAAHMIPCCKTGRHLGELLLQEYREVNSGIVGESSLTCARYWTAERQTHQALGRWVAMFTFDAQGE